MMSTNISSKKHLQNMAEKLCRCTHFNKGEVEALCHVFKSFCPAPKMDRTRFRDILHNSFCMTEDLIMDRVFKAFDQDNDGYVNLEEWVKGLSVFLRGDFNEKKKFCFDVFDTNGDGFISRDEMFMLLKSSLVRKEIVSAYYEEEAQQTTEEDPDEGIKDLVDICLKKIDFDHDGRLSFDDYSQAVDADTLLLEVLGQCLPDTKRWIAFEETYICQSQDDSVF